LIGSNNVEKSGVNFKELRFHFSAAQAQEDDIIEKIFVQLRDLRVKNWGFNSLRRGWCLLCREA
jgi:hypothetical protein